MEVVDTLSLIALLTDCGVQVFTRLHFDSGAAGHSGQQRQKSAMQLA